MPAIAAIPAAGAVLAQAKAVPVVGGVVSKVTSVFAGSDAESDRNRDAALNAAYGKAVQGDVNAALYIRQRTGRYEEVNVPGYGKVSSGGSDHSQRIAREHWAALKKLTTGIAGRADALYITLRSGGAAPGSPQALAAAVTSYRLFGIPAWILGLVLLAAVGLYLFKSRS